jgi:hypothetical protein
MLLFGKLLDPQPPSDVAVAPGVEHSTTNTIIITIMATPHDHSRPSPSLARR